MRAGSGTNQLKCKRDPFLAATGTMVEASLLAAAAACALELHLDKKAVGVTNFSDTIERHWDNP